MSKDFSETSSTSCATSTLTATSYPQGGDASARKIPIEKDGCSVLHWYVAYTRARHEKSVSAQFARRSIESFLPLYEVVHRWKDRKARIKLPLFAGYVFVRISLANQLRVLQVPGVVELVSFRGSPVAVPEAELTALRKGLASGLHVNPHPFLAAGRPVRITRGPFAGITGIVVRRKALYRVVVSFHLIQRSLVLELEASDVSQV